MCNKVSEMHLEHNKIQSNSIRQTLSAWISDHSSIKLKKGNNKKNKQLGKELTFKETFTASFLRTLCPRGTENAEGRWHSPCP